MDDRLTDLAARVRRELGSTLETDALTRALFSTDASVYRVAPAAVFAPRDAAEVAMVMGAAAELDIPITGRGAGTSCCGNSVGPGLVLDFARHMHRIIDIDPDSATARVEPGAVQARLQRAAAPAGLRFGPDPSSADRCTIGGMIGNNACGPRALGYGRTSDNLLGVDVVLAGGTTARFGPGGAGDIGARSLRTSLRAIAVAGADTIAAESGRFSRQISGYALEHLAADDIPKLLTGSEGTLAIVTEATVRLVRDAPVKTMVALGYPTIADAADDIMTILEFAPTACEGFGSRIVDVVRERGLPVPDLPTGDGWNFVELVGDDTAEVAARAQRLVAAAAAIDGRLVTDAREAAALWQIRADGAGLASVAFDRRAYAGWEDSAVPPARLGAYLRELTDLLVAHRLRGLPYGHFGDGCVHCRIDFPLGDADGADRYRDFLFAAADLVASYGGSASGEHGDGRARSELLPRIYSPAALELMRRVKRAFDPAGVLNPGVLLAADPVTAHLREQETRGSAFAIAHPEFTEAAHRCSGVGKCLADGPGVMCPSYRATRREQDSTRGRAHVLQELANGSVITGGWQSPEVAEALDLCLACKACSTECPAGVDMADLKSRTLAAAYRGRLRPASHYSMGWLATWGRAITRLRLGGLVNLLGASPIAGVVKRLAGVDARRALPRFASRPVRNRTDAAVAAGTRVVVWADSFSDAFEGSQVAAVLAVLRGAGYAPELLSGTACCGLPWITTGQRDVAARQMRTALARIEPLVTAGITVVAVEPSCLAALREADTLLGTDAGSVPAGVRTLSEVLVATPGWRAPDLTGTTVVVQPHCHHRAVLGWEPDAQVLAATGAEVVTVPGCCGLAGNFGFETGHYDVSVAIAGLELLPALEAHPDAVVVADGFSCRTQVTDLTGRPAVTLAELLAGEVPNR